MTTIPEIITRLDAHDRTLTFIELRRTRFGCEKVLQALIDNPNSVAFLKLTILGPSGDLPGLIDTYLRQTWTLEQLQIEYKDKRANLFHIAVASGLTVNRSVKFLTLLNRASEAPQVNLDGFVHSLSVVPRSVASVWVLTTDAGTQNQYLTVKARFDPMTATTRALPLLPPIVKAIKQLQKISPEPLMITLTRDAGSVCDHVHVLNALAHSLNNVDRLTVGYKPQVVISPEFYFALERYLTRTRTLKRVVLVGEMFTTELFMVVARALRTNKSIKELAIVELGFEDEKISDAFVDALIENPERPADTKWILMNSDYSIDLYQFVCMKKAIRERMMSRV